MLLFISMEMQSGRSGVVLCWVRSLGPLFSDQVAALQARSSDTRLCVLQKAKGAQDSLSSVSKNQFTSVNAGSLRGEKVKVICSWVMIIREKQRGCGWIVGLRYCYLW